MSDWLNLVGRDYEAGGQDCYGLVRDYYQQEWDLSLANYARPDRFWEDPSLDLYAAYTREGFQPVFDGCFEIGDAVLMQVLAPINSHAAVIVEDNQILHHLPDKLSGVDALRPKWINRVTVHLRHPWVTERREDTHETVHLHEVFNANVLRDPEIQDAIAAQMGPDS